MPEDASLDAFAAAEADDGGEGAAESASGVESEETDSTAESADPVEPARSTYAWSPDGGECADCGESVERRWRAEGQRDGGLVCADCKEW